MVDLTLSEIKQMIQTWHSTRTRTRTRKKCSFMCEKETPSSFILFFLLQLLSERNAGPSELFLGHFVQKVKLRNSCTFSYCSSRGKKYRFMIDIFFDMNDLFLPCQP